MNIAARLEQAADPGEILIGEQTYRLARSAIVAELIEPLVLKGKAEPLSAYRLLGIVEGAPPLERRLDAPLVGRREDLARVRSAFDDAVSARRCRVVTVLGPPGIGKSRLAREVSTVLDGEALVLTGRCLPYGEGITYWPLVEIFREVGAEDELETALSAGAAGGDLLVRAEGARAAGAGSGRSPSSSRTSTGRSRRSSISPSTSATGHAMRRSSCSALRGRSCSTSGRPGAGSRSHSSRYRRSSPKS